MKQLKLVFVCEQIKAQQVIPDKVKRAFVESFCNHSPSLPLNIKQFSSESLWKHSYIWRYFAKVWTLGLQSLLPDGLQVPVNGDVDRKAGGLEEVRPQVPLHDPCLGETHLQQQSWAFFRLCHFQPLCGRRRETDSRLMASSTSLLEQKRNPSLFIPPCVLIKGYFDLALQVQPPKLGGEGQIIPNSAAPGGRI